MRPIAIILFSILTSCSSADENDYSISIGDNDVTVTLNVQHADAGLNTIHFSTDIQKEIIMIQLDTLDLSGIYSFGYNCGSESAYLIRAIFKDDTVSFEGYAEHGYLPSLVLKAKEFEVVEYM